MYNTYDLSEVIYLCNKYTGEVRLIGNHKEFIHFLARTFINFYGDYIYSDNQYIDNSSTTFEWDERKWIFYDGYGRIINPRDYKEKALLLCKDKFLGKKRNFNWHNSKVYKGIFRKTPVPTTGKVKGGPSAKPRRVAGLFRMYNNPEYKSFNRGSKKVLPDGWDYPYRQTQRCWKKHRKHQYKEK